MRMVIAKADEKLRLMLIFAASTGARAGEQWAARWKDVDLDKCELRINRRVDAYGEEGAPKSKAGVRTVPLSAQLVAALKEWKVRSKFSKPEDLIFSKSTRWAHRPCQFGQAGFPAVIRRRSVHAFHVARAPTLRCIQLDRSRHEAEGDTDIRRPCVPPNHDGSLRPPIPKRGSQKSNGPDRQRAIQIEHSLNNHCFHVPRMCRGSAG